MLPDSYLVASSKIVISRSAYRLLRMLRQRPDDYDVHAVASELQTSKSGVERALAELEEANIITITEEEL